MIILISKFKPSFDNFDKIQLFMFSFTCLCFWYRIHETIILFKIIFIPMFAPKSGTVLALSFRFWAHFKSIFV